MADVVTSTDPTDINVGSMEVTELLTVLSSASAGDVVMVSSNTFYVACTGLSLTAGTWLIMSTALVGRTATTATRYTSRLRDTTNTATLTECEHHYPSANPHYLTLTLHHVITVASTTVVELQCAANQATSSVIKRNAVTNSGTPNNATHITAIKIA